MDGDATMKLPTAVLALVALLTMLALAACAPSLSETAGMSGDSADRLSDELKSFSTQQELREYLKQGQQLSGLGSERTTIDFAPGIDIAVAESADGVGVAKLASGYAGDAPSGAASSFSETNIQVEGVDEADIVKNDGRYIYALVQDKLVIVDAYPAEDAEVVSEVKIEGRPRELFVNIDTLIVFAEQDEQVLAIPEYSYVPQLQYRQKTAVLVYDVSDRSDPELEKEFSLSGGYFSSRMIGDYVYVVSQEWTHYSNPIVMPIVRAGGEALPGPKVFYFDNPEDSFQMHTIGVIDLDALSIDAESFLLGSSNTLYVSGDAIYIAYQKNRPYGSMGEEQQEIFFEVVVPLLPSPVRAEVASAKEDGSLTASEKWDRIEAALQDMYAALSEKEQSAFLEKVSAAAESARVKHEQDRQKTIIHKIKISGSYLDYVGQGEVQGYLLNHFSLDEFEGNLRVATTVSVWTRNGADSENNVYVLDSGMDVIGSLEGLAPEERIYSTRFMGDRLYMVTFRQVDPFFVIGLSEPASPKVLGELKIPGFSEYLQAYDGNHVFGIGRDTDEDKWGRVTTGGIKISLFNVKDVTNPKEVDSMAIGMPGSDSEALRDHKAVLFDREKQLLVIPVREVKDISKGSGVPYAEQVWAGAYVFGSSDDGLDIKGKVSHAEKEANDYWWASPYTVRRSLYMDDVLYTVSSKFIKANALDDPSEEIAQVELPYTDIQDGPVMMY